MKERLRLRQGNMTVAAVEARDLAAALITMGPYIAQYCQDGDVTLERRVGSRWKFAASAKGDGNE